MKADVLAFSYCLELESVLIKFPQISTAHVLGVFGTKFLAEIYIDLI